ncbi:MAG: CoA transferase [Sphingomonas sp.]|uniref:CaiB/BaiF CoA transferase family protein n=1 Tax=Sphingomonas sp. TaxID=28214 RepID=UPI001AC1CF61|nr:CaiB/BaiF CoA-transferase family protein [Sphingomonas sp.]MBN8807860.1 CoA transferase [Sphingomonas sp.]
MPGPLAGLRIVELAGIGPAPFCGMMLADHGAEVIRIDRPGVKLDSRDPLLRGRTAMNLDLKSPDDIARLREVVKTVDGLIEGFRPGVIERLGIGPDILLADNPKLVIGRMTGWGQDGPYAQAAGHDINYIALSGVLGGIGRAGERPVPPINLVGDFGGGAMMLAFGMVAGLLAVKNGAGGQVIDCAMTDGSALLMAMMWGFRATGLWRDERGVNLLDGGAPFYDTYETMDGGYVAIGSLEPQFYALLREKLELTDDPLFDAQHDRARWPAMRERLTQVFRSRTRYEWCALMEGSDVCFAPVLSMDEAAAHPHNAARNTFVERDGIRQPAPAPRFSG